MSWVLLAFLVVGLQTHEPTLGDALALQRQAEALACSIQDDACLGEEFRLRGARRSGRSPQRSSGYGVYGVGSSLPRGCLATDRQAQSKPTDSGDGGAGLAAARR